MVPIDWRAARDGDKRNRHQAGGTAGLRSSATWSPALIGQSRGRGLLLEFCNNFQCRDLSFSLIFQLRGERSVLPDLNGGASCSALTWSDLVWSGTFVLLGPHRHHRHHRHHHHLQQPRRHHVEQFFSLIYFKLIFSLLYICYVFIKEQKICV